MIQKIEASSEVRRILTLIARAIVDSPLAVKVEVETATEETVMHLRVAPNDLQRIEGPEGEIKRSLRNILADMSAKYHHPFVLDIAAIESN
jgi:predicted RNA-binding protein YlqC (UPF0109 family)